MVWPSMLNFGMHVKHAKTNRFVPLDFFVRSTGNRLFELNFQNMVIFGDLQALEFNELLLGILSDFHEKEFGCGGAAILSVLPGKMKCI